MAQLFHPHADLIVKLVVGGLLVTFVGSALIWRFIYSAPAAEGTPVEQPVPFSHKHHVGDDGIDCRYCHTSVERSSFAGLPPTETCMTCHSQIFTDAPPLAPVIQGMVAGRPIPWRRVHDLPDFVYFNHAIHVNKGVGCSTCHGRVDQMPLTWRVAPLTMQWCLGCHRNPAPHLRPQDRIFDMSWTPPPQQAVQGERLLHDYRIDKRRLTDCSLCHR